MLDDLNLAGTKGGGEDDDDEDEQLETYEAFETRINAFVALHIRQSSSSRDSYKEGLVYQERKNLIAQFIKSTHSKKCQNPSCGA